MRHRPSPLMSRYVPYLSDRVPEAARPYLPTHADDAPTLSAVRTFIQHTRNRPAVRMQVLGVLRAHAANGAEMPTALIAVFVAVFGGLASTLVALGSAHAWAAWFVAVGAFLLVLLSGRAIVAAHARRITALVWLAAYQDGIARDARRPRGPLTFLMAAGR